MKRLFSFKNNWPMGDKKDKEAQLPWITYNNYSRHGRLAYLFTLQLLTREFDLGYCILYTVRIHLYIIFLSLLKCNHTWVLHRLNRVYPPVSVINQTYLKSTPLLLLILLGGENSSEPWQQWSKSRVVSRVLKNRDPFPRWKVFFPV